MKGKKLAAKIMLGLLLVTPYGFNQAFAAEGILYNQETEINEDILLNIENPENRLFALRAQAYLNESAFNVKLNGETINISLSADETAGKTGYFNGIEAGTYNNGNLKYDGPNLYLGNENTKNIIINTNVSGADNGTIGLWAYNQSVGVQYQTNDGPQINVNGDNLTITVHAEDASSYGICAQNASTATTGTPATININTNNTTINATSGLADAGSAIVAMSEGIVKINSNLVVNAETKDCKGKHTSCLLGIITQHQQVRIIVASEIHIHVVCNTKRFANVQTTRNRTTVWLIILELIEDTVLVIFDIGQQNTSRLFCIGNCFIANFL